MGLMGLEGEACRIMNLLARENAGFRAFAVAADVGL